MLGWSGGENASKSLQCIAPKGVEWDGEKAE
jgi:hypothetical protein